jgi:hypothetical protein
VLLLSRLVQPLLREMMMTICICGVHMISSPNRVRYHMIPSVIMIALNFKALKFRKCHGSAAAAAAVIYIHGTMVHIGPSGMLPS